MYGRLGLIALGLLLATTVRAGDVEIVMVVLSKQSDKWVCETTLRHDDRGWDHYADAWRVVTSAGEILGTRTLYHPHVDEQPFTRSLRDITIPADTKMVFIEAHDKIHGWSATRVEVDLTKKAGKRYRINTSP
ncbi:MAG: hypothetical protein OES46_11125 [Gammaproteobacteria bacterium]|jgi:hypothetical protein|nr:hypothetical protein [Gammaproteobacteria bacterium]